MPHDGLYADEFPDQFTGHDFAKCFVGLVVVLGHFVELIDTRLPALSTLFDSLLTKGLWRQVGSRIRVQPNDGHVDDRRVVTFVRLLGEK